MDRITKDDHAICTTEYSRIVPLENGEVSRCIFHPLGLPGFLWLEIIIKKKELVRRPGIQKSLLEDSGRFFPVFVLGWAVAVPPVACFLSYLRLSGALPSAQLAQKSSG